MLLTGACSAPPRRRRRPWAAGSGQGGSGGGLRARGAPVEAWAVPAVCAGLRHLGGRRCQPSADAGSVMGRRGDAGAVAAGDRYALRRLPGRLHGSLAGRGGRDCGRHSLLTAAPPRPRRGLRLGRGPVGRYRVAAGRYTRFVSLLRFPASRSPARRGAQSGWSHLAGRGRGMAEGPGGSGELVRRGSAGDLMINSRRRWLWLE